MVDPAIIRSLLRYDGETGRLYWLPRTASTWRSLGRIYTGSEIQYWNRRFAGAEAFKKPVGGGYLCGHLIERREYAHRIVWAWHHASWPDGEIDHIDGSTDNNRIENLRVVSRAENCRNIAASSRNKSGFVGVSFSRKSNKWAATIQVSGRQKWLGYFSTKQDAIAARLKANEDHGYHHNHGRQTCTQL